MGNILYPSLSSSPSYSQGTNSSGNAFSYSSNVRPEDSNPARYDDVIINSKSNNIGELHLFIEDGKKDGKYLYELDDTNNHVYYVGD